MPRRSPMFNGSFCFPRSPVNTGLFDGSTRKSPTDGKNCHRQRRYRRRRCRPAACHRRRHAARRKRIREERPALSPFTFSCHFPDHHPTSVSHLSFYYPFLLSRWSLRPRSLSRTFAARASIGKDEAAAIFKREDGRSERPEKRKNRRNEWRITRGIPAPPMNARRYLRYRAARGKYLRAARARRID